MGRRSEVVVEINYININNYIKLTIVKRIKLFETVRYM